MSIYIYNLVMEASVLRLVRIVKLAVTKLLIKQYALLADVVFKCTQTYHCIKQILNVMSIFLVVQLLNLVATKLVIEQSSPFPHVSSECTQIFHCIK